MNYGELKEDEYYVGEWDGRRAIFIHSKHKETPGINSNDVFEFTEKWCSGRDVKLRTPTLEEKHWLDVCIKENKIISYEKAMESFNKKMSIQEIQEECKRRFPIGCTFKNPCNNQNYTIEENDIDTYKIIENQYIDGGESKGYLYYKGKYAELIETPEVIVPEYVECLENDNEYIIKNKIYKIDSWKKNNVWGICNIDCDVYKAGKSLCFDNWFENNQKWKHSTKEAYDNQLSKQKPLTPEQCYNTEIEVGDIVETNGSNITKYSNKTTKIVVTKIDKDFFVQPCFKGDNMDNHDSFWVYPQVNINNFYYKIITKANSYKQVDISSPQVTNEITIPKVLKKTEKVNFDFQNCEVKNINVPILLKQNKKIKQIKIEKFELFI